MNAMDQEDLCPLKLACFARDIEGVRRLLMAGADVKAQSKDVVTPRITPLHVAVQRNALEIVRELLNHAQIDPNRPDQWGFSPLHYATALRNKEMVVLLLSKGASVISPSKGSSSALDLAQYLKFDEIIDTLNSRAVLESDPSLPRLRDWLTALGAGEYVSRFINAGYDFDSISSLGLDDTDLDCVGIPKEKEGLRKKLKNRIRISEFQVKGADDSDEGDNEDNDDEDEDSDDEA